MRQFIFPVLTAVRRLIYISVYYFDHLRGKKNLVSILCYHSIQQDNWRFSTDPGEFKKQIKFLKNEYEFITMDDAASYINGQKSITKPSVVLTFDDGYKNLMGIKDYLKENGIKPTLFIIANQANRKELDSYLPFLTNEELKQLHTDGWTIGSHSATHAAFSALNSEKIETEVIGSKQLLEQALGISINYFAYPKGAYTQEVLKAVRKAGYILGLSMDDDVIRPGIETATVPRVGVDRTHTLSEFKTLMSPSAVKLRNFIKKTFIAKFF